VKVLNRWTLRLRTVVPAQPVRQQIPVSTLEGFFGGLLCDQWPYGPPPRRPTMET
jgi:hypothetical protein